MARTTELEIIQGDGSLYELLRKVKGSKITMATAFARGTEPLIDTLLKNGNELTLVVGTINYFTDPVFIDHCRELASQKNSRLRLFVDFRGSHSIHWKLYLVEPDIVIIGSPNLTATGLSMQRDTAVCIQDSALYGRYRAMVNELQRQQSVLSSADPAFEALLAEYRPKHRKQWLRLLQEEPPQPLDFQDWVKRYESQILQLFIWEGPLTPAEEKEFERVIKPGIRKEYQAVGSTRRPAVSIVGVAYDEGAEASYEEDTLILTMKNNGTYAALDTLRRVIPGRRGSWWLCRVGKRNQPPFTLTPPLRKVFREMAQDWYDDGKTYLDSKDLRELADRLRS